MSSSDWPGRGEPGASHPGSQADPRSCQVCGRAPAEELILRQHTGWVIWGTQRKYQGTWCRSCALAMFREVMGKTLVTGWWGVVSFVLYNPYCVLANLYTRQRIGKMPRPAPSSDPTVGPPLPVGKSVWKRAGGLLAAGFGVIFALGLIGAAVEGVSGSAANDSVMETCYASEEALTSIDAFLNTGDEGTVDLSGDEWSFVTQDLRALSSAAVRSGRRSWAQAANEARTAAADYEAALWRGETRSAAPFYRPVEGILFDCDEEGLLGG